jgi:Uma2 family endonuclease
VIAALEKPEIRKYAAPLTLLQYHTLVNEGVISNDVEFLEGVLIEKMPKSPLHEFIITQLVSLLQKHMRPDFFVRKEGPISIQNSEPEPDISIVRGKPSDYRLQHPQTAEFVAEISVSSQSIDFAKAEIYARAKIPVYLIIDAAKNIVYLYTNPENDKYASQVQYHDKFSLGIWDITLDLKSLLH